MHTAIELITTIHFTSKHKAIIIKIFSALHF